MRILLLAPQPFYQERGTPIAVRLLAQTLCAAGHEVDLLAYNEGTDVHIEGLRIERTPRIPGVRNIPIGFSWKKIVCDMALSVRLVGLVWRNDYQVIHAVEESIFPAFVVNWFARKKLIYDMDSSMADQLVERWAFLRWVRYLFDAFEWTAVRSADAVVAVCQELAVKAQRYAPKQKVYVLEDVPLDDEDESAGVEDLRSELGIEAASSVPLALYVGNLEHYQGVDLMLEGFAQAAAGCALHLVVIGGSAAECERYRARAAALGVEGRAHFVGARPVSRLNQYLRQADILLSPRLKGVNTPMKIYSYLAAGKAVLATDIRSHTQVLDENCALLVAPQAQAVAAGLVRLTDDKNLRARLGAAAQGLAQERYSQAAYRRKLDTVYAQLAVGGE